nr:PREDICTED: uncharacterized protein LOC107079200 isoform X1 [Lepisosteus oculatus]
MLPKRSSVYSLLSFSLVFSCLAGMSKALSLKVHENPAVGYVHRSVMLPVSYTIAKSYKFLQITWSFNSELLLKYVRPCLPTSDKACKPQQFIAPAYRGRVSLFPQNASLQIEGLRPTDSGNYSLRVSLSDREQRAVVCLLVAGPRSKDTGEELTSQRSLTSAEEQSTNRERDKRRMELINVIRLVLSVLIPLFCYFLLRWLSKSSCGLQGSQDLLQQATSSRQDTQWTARQAITGDTLTKTCTYSQ